MQHPLNHTKKAKKGTVLFIIDPQNDFHPGGSLAIATADDDSRRVADLISKKMHEIDEIVVTLDSHQRIHIAHGLFWLDPAGKHPEPFTIITAKEIEQGKWRAAVPQYQEIALIYARKLEQGGRFKICIWPEHCIIGTPGHNVTKPLMDVINQWAATRLKEVQWITKGQNIFTEMYSALRAEVPTDDPRTMWNLGLIDFLKEHSRVLVCGQALSHCVNFSVRDLMDNYSEGHDEVTIITDGCSPVAGFEASAEQFLKDMKVLGLRLRTTEELLREW
eukprot:EG_transcript_11944